MTYFIYHLLGRVLIVKIQCLVALSLVSLIASVGCSDSSSNPPPDVDGGSCFADSDVCTADDECCSLSCEVGECVPPFTGSALGASCASSATCNSDNCNTEGGVCVGPVGECSAAEVACEFGWECCSGNCGGGICTDPMGSCHAFGVACITDGNCCTGNCLGMSCAIQIILGGDTGDSCTHNGDCNDDVCLSGKCVAASCDPEGTSCTPGADDGTCCSGACSETSGECSAVPACVDNGELCGAHWECCSSLCSPYSGKCEPAAPPPV